MKRWIIRCKTQPELFWSNALGWTSRSEAEVFDNDDREQSSLPYDGEWIETKRKTA